MSRERRGGRDFGQRRDYGQRRGFGGPSRGFPPKPVEVGKEYDVEIQETSRRGEGIARIKGLVCFVPNSKPGDKVKIRITRISRRFAEAEVVGKGTEGAGEETEAAAEEEEEAGEKKAETAEEETETEAETAETEETETDTSEEEEE